MITRLQKETDKALSVFQKAQDKLLKVIGQAEMTIGENTLEINRIEDENRALKNIAENAQLKAQKIGEILG